MLIHIFNDQKILSLSSVSIQNIVKSLLTKEKVCTDELAIHLITDEKIAKLHEEFFNDPSPTDCITFPIDRLDQKKQMPTFLGEVFISIETAKNYAQKNNLSILDEITLYLIHGILHLLGYDDISEKDRKVMREKEKDCIQYLKDNQIGLLRR